MREGAPPRLWIVLAFAAIYVIWGSTYLAMRFAVEAVPPFLGAAIRWTLAGAALFTYAIAREERLPSPREWIRPVIVGLFLVLGGNGMVMWAEQTVESGVAALVIGTVPLWIVVLDVLVNRTRLTLMTVGALVVGLVGVALLVWEPGSTTVRPSVGILALLFASLSWAVGSLVSRRGTTQRTPILFSGMQMLAGAAALAIVGFASGEANGFAEPREHIGAWLALGYLAVFGSIVGYSCYIWLLRVTSPAKVSTYAYVNPLIAIILGTTLADEALTWNILVGAVAILGSVVLILRRGQAGPKAPPASPAETPSA